MAEYSPGVLVAWQIAAWEAVASQHEFIEREHLMIGLAKAEDVVAEAGAEKIAERFGNADMLRKEIQCLSDCFRRHGVDPVKTRRKLRQLMGTGPYAKRESETIHRSPGSRDVFNTALAHAAAAHTEVHCLHLFAAVLDKPGVRIAQALTSGGGDVQALQKDAAKAMGEFGVVVAGRGDAKASGLLSQCGTDLTQLAKQGKIEPLIGRRKELLQIVRTLSRKAKTNPLLLGDPGVGKTALVRALALRISEGKVPALLRNKRIIELKLGALVAGTKYRGEFEERVTRIVEEVSTHPEIILFIDEIHTMVSAGASEGGLDAANLLKPALASADLRCIGSTTLGEYRKYFEKDAALARRFQPIVVEEPSTADAVKILEGLRERYESHHGVRIGTSALRAAVELACRYLPDRRLPDKALDLLDEACARVKIGSANFGSAGDELMPATPVTADTIAAVVSEWTGVPVARLSGATQEKLQHMADTLAKRVIGQPEAIEKVTRLVTMSQAGLRHPQRPVGVFLFAGPTGVGKTELCRALAEFLFGSDQEMIRLDMSEYKEKHTVSRLIGAPPGYIGHDTEGQLTGKLRRKPYSVVLLDEIEKAHPEVCDLFLQLFDEGRLTDAQGRTVDGRNAIFIMTSNVKMSASPPAHSIGFVVPDVRASDPAWSDARETIFGDLREAFRAEFLNRIDEIIVFRPLTMDDLAKIAWEMLERIRRSLLAQNITLTFEDGALELIVRAGYDPHNGARPLARVIDRIVSGPLSQKLIAGEIQPGDRIRVVAEANTITFMKSGPGEETGMTQS